MTKSYIQEFRKNPAMTDRVYLNTPIENILSKDGEKVIFVHVGKCAGSTAMRQFRKRLTNDFSIFEMHCFNANEILDRLIEEHPQDSIFVITTRDPISRFVSAFNWDKHNLYMKGSLQGTDSERSFEAFPTVNDLATSLALPDTDLHARARKFSKFGHMGMGQSWYTPLNKIEKLPDDRTFLVDSSSVKNDLNAFFEFAGVPGIGEDEELPKVRGDYGEEYGNPDKLFPKHLSAEARDCLRTHLEMEYRVVEGLNGRYRQSAVGRPV